MRKCCCSLSGWFTSSVSQKRGARPCCLGAWPSAQANKPQHVPGCRCRFRPAEVMPIRSIRLCILPFVYCSTQVASLGSVVNYLGELNCNLEHWGYQVGCFSVAPHYCVTMLCVIQYLGKNGLWQLDASVGCTASCPSGPTSRIREDPWEDPCTQQVGKKP